MMEFDQHIHNLGQICIVLGHGKIQGSFECLQLWDLLTNGR